MPHTGCAAADAPVLLAACTAVETMAVPVAAYHNGIFRFKGSTDNIDIVHITLSTLEGRM